MTYDSPCIKDPEFYETSIALLSPQIKNMNECKSSLKKSDDARIAFCKNPKQYLKIECVNDRKINLNVTAELADTKNLKTTATAKKFVDMTINEVRKVAINGNLTMRGTDKKRYAARETSKAGIPLHHILIYTIKMKLEKNKKFEVASYLPFGTFDRVGCSWHITRNHCDEFSSQICRASSQNVPQGRLVHIIVSLNSIENEVVNNLGELKIRRLKSKNRKAKNLGSINRQIKKEYFKIY